MKTTAGLVSLILCVNMTLASDVRIELAKHLGEVPSLVVVACGAHDEDIAVAEDLIENTEWTLLVCSSSATCAKTIREIAKQKGVLGARASVVTSSDLSLWLADDMADAVWVSPRLEKAPQKMEIQRVLRPGGVFVVGERVGVKPIEAGTDEWRHPYHDPSNNVVSSDQVAKLPGELRFQTSPVFAAMPNQTLLAGGRIFFFSGHIAFHQREEPTVNRLTVLNAYNGLTLWSQPLDPRFVVHDVAKLATNNEVAFAQGNILRVLDASDGRQKGSYKAPNEAIQAGDTDWKWIAQEGDTLWAAFGPPDAQVAPHRPRRQMGHWPWHVANDRYQTIIDNFGNARRLVAFKLPEMKVVWSVSEAQSFDARALCMENGRIFQFAPMNYAVARDAKNGKELWRNTVEKSGKLFAAIGAAIKRQGWGLGWATYCCARANKNVICIAGPPFKKTIGIDFVTGDLLWSSDVESPHPFFFEDSLFLVPRVGGPAVGCQRIDPKTGEALDKFSLGVIGSCTRLTVTPTQFFYRPGGGEGRTVYVDLATRKLAKYEGVVRPGCFDGVIPAYGRLYWMPLACDCWQVHGTFSMAPRKPMPQSAVLSPTADWNQPESATAARSSDWPMFRATSAGELTVNASVGKQATELWRRDIAGNALSAPTSVRGQIFVGDANGSVLALDATTGETQWETTCSAGVLYPPAYWKGRVVYGACDGTMYVRDAAKGHEIGHIELAPERRFVNIMGQLMSTWPVGGGLIVDQKGIAYVAAGSTAADGTIAAAIDLQTGKTVWQQTYSLDRRPNGLSFGVQSNLLLKSGRLFINGGAPVGIIALDAQTGDDPQLVARLEAGKERYLEPDGKPCCAGLELYSDKRTRTTIFKRHQGRTFFRAADRLVALVGDRLFCSRDVKALDRIVDIMNKDPRTGGKFGGDTVPRKAMSITLDDAMLWASKTADVRGMAIGNDGVVVLHRDSVEAVTLDGESLWVVPLPAAPVRWGIALTDTHCVVALEDGRVICLNRKGKPS